jgi:hypothetical protein
MQGVAAAHGRWPRAPSLAGAVVEAAASLAGAPSSSPRRALEIRDAGHDLLSPRGSLGLLSFLLHLDPDPTSRWRWW